MYVLLNLISFMMLFHIIIIPSEKHDKLNQVALLWSLFLLMMFLGLYLCTINSETLQYAQNLYWLNYLGMNSPWGNILFMLDNLSLFFVGLSMLLMPICMLMSWYTMKTLKKEFLVALLFMLVLLMNVFTMMDLLGFYMLFETILIPMFLIMGIWGSSEEKMKAAYYFFFYTLVGSLLMLISIFKIYTLTGTTNYHNLMHLELPKTIQCWLFLGFFASLAVKVPMFPYHIWLPQAHVEAPMAGSILLAGILLKLGGYGFIRFSIPLFPMASEMFTPVMIVLSIIAVIYGALTTCSQSDMKSLIAYSSVSHMGFVTMSIFTHCLEGYMASVVMMIAHGLVSSGLFMSSFNLYTSFHTSMIKYFKGMTTCMPLLSSITFILVLGNISFPGTMNFMAEFFSLISATKYSMYVTFSLCMGIFMGTLYSFFMFNKIYFGSLSNFTYSVSDLTSLEYQSFMPLTVLIMLLGLMPNLIMSLLVNTLIFQMSL